MIKEFLLNWIKNQKYGIVVYPTELFDLRIQEEMIRADESKEYFVYVEVNFAKIRETLKTDGDEVTFWKAFLKSLATTSRGSDIYGILEKESGFGLVLLDSKMDGWIRLEGRIRESCKLSLDNIQRSLVNGCKAFVYPACLTQSQEPVLTK